MTVKGGHEFIFKNLINRASVIPGVDFKHISDIIAEDIDDKEHCTHIYKDIYKYVFNDHLHADECLKLIELIYSTSYKLWTLEETNLVAKKLDYDFDKKPYTSEEFRAAMYLIRECFDLPMKESNISMDSLVYGRLADHYLMSNGTVKLVNEYFDRITCK